MLVNNTYRPVKRCKISLCNKEKEKWVATGEIHRVARVKHRCSTCIHICRGLRQRNTVDTSIESIFLILNVHIARRLVNHLVVIIERNAVRLTLVSALVLKSRKYYAPQL